MNRSQIAARIDVLRNVIQQANQAYYELDEPELSDAEYDRLFRELQDLEAANPNLLTPDSPTQRVGSAPAAALHKHAHLRPMLSLANAFSHEELVAWVERNTRLNPDVVSADYTTEIKIDGAAVSLTYDEGQLVMGASRGNGIVGENLTANLKTIEDVPLVLRGRDYPALMEIRGEVYIPVDTFRHLNREREEAGDPPLANPRNAAAGSLRQLDPAMTRARRLRMLAFHIEPLRGTLPARTHHEVLALLEQWGFRVESHHGLHPNLGDVRQRVIEVESLLSSLPFAADGVVIKVNARNLQEDLGVVGGREPRWAIARKFAPEVAITRLLDVKINVGRTGALNPWAVLEPVELGGVTVSSATLHNQDVVSAKDVRIGDWVEVVRAGEVIPQVLGPLRERRNGSERSFDFPVDCPACGEPVERPPDEATVYCVNPACPGRIYESIVHFASRTAMDIRGLGAERIRQLLEAGLVKDVSDLYRVTPAQLVQLERFAKLSAEQLVRAIEDSKARPLCCLLFGLGIRHVGKTVAVLLARHFGTMERLAAADQEAISAVPGVGPVIAEAVTDWFGNRDNHDLVTRLGALGLQFSEPDAVEQDGALNGKTYVLTGSMENMTRDEARHHIERAGGRVVGGVTGKTDTLVAGRDPGSKLEAAKQRGIEIIDEAELRRRLGLTLTTDDGAR